jgi:MtN3 and saliva related transmembrane protein
MPRTRQDLTIRSQAAALPGNYGVSSRFVRPRAFALDQFLFGLGAAAAVLTSLSYIPQVRKAFPRGATEDLSLKMLLALTTGLVLWIVYGALKGDLVIAIANAVGASLSGAVLAFKIRDVWSEEK